MISVVKIGGAILESKDELDLFLKTFHELSNPKILVHGGGRNASKLMVKLGLTPQMIEGRRITNQDTLDVIIMVYSGLNKELVAKLQAMGEKSLGLCGADANVLLGVKRPSEPIDYGFVGDVGIESVNGSWIMNQLQTDTTLVFSPLCHDGSGQLLNTNADTIASVLAQHLQQYEDVHLTFAFEKQGVLKDVKDENSVIPTLTKHQFQEAIEQQIIHEGMIPKLKNAWEAKEAGVSKVRICKFSAIGKENMGTEIKHI